MVFMTALMGTMKEYIAAVSQFAEKKFNLESSAIYILFAIDIFLIYFIFCYIYLSSKKTRAFLFLGKYTEVDW